MTIMNTAKVKELREVWSSFVPNFRLEWNDGLGQTIVTYANCAEDVERILTENDLRVEPPASYLATKEIQ